MNDTAGRPESTGYLGNHGTESAGASGRGDLEYREAALGRFKNLGRGGGFTRLGIMGGTFDPVHAGHLLCAEQAREHYGLDGVLFVTAGDPAYKQGLATDPLDRLEMVRLATRDNPFFDVSRIEVDREGVTYTVDTLRELHRLLPDNVSLYFITGADAMRDITSWKDAAELASLAVFVGATRPGFDLDAAQRAQEESHKGFDVRYFEIPSMEISSSDIRDRVREGRSIRYLVPGEVCDYILAHNLYTEGSG